MRKIAGPGHVSNAFVDYDAVTNPNGTVHTADWGNDVQNELVGIQDEFSIAEAAGTNKYVLAAIKGIAIQNRYGLGDVYSTMVYKEPAAFDKDNPDDFYPGFCLDAIETNEDLSATNWPDLVPALRAIPFFYNRGKTGEKSAFDVTNWAVSSNVGTLTFEDDTPENYILGGLAGDNLVHGSYSNWRTITLASAIGNIPAGDYAITAIDSLARTVTFAVTAADGSAAVTATASFYPHRIAGSTTTARLFEVSGKAIASPDSSDRVSGLRMLDQFQGWQLGSDSDNSGAREVWGTVGTRDRSLDTSPLANFSEVQFRTTVQGSANMLKAKNDGINGPPRTGSQTHGPEMVGHLYIWGRTYVELP